MATTRLMLPLLLFVLGCSRREVLVPERGLPADNADLRVPAENALVLELDLPANAPQFAGLLPVKLTIINMSSVSVAFYSIRPESDYSLAVIDASGRRVEMTDLGRSATAEPRAARRIRRILPPGQSFSETIADIGKYFVLDRGAEYSLCVAREVIAWGEHGPVGTPILVRSRAVGFRAGAG